LPCDIRKFAQKPSLAAYDDGLTDEAVSYARVTQNFSQMRGCLASGYPFIYGFTVYESLGSQQVAKSGVVPMPAHNETVVGGPAIMAMG
jgi:hypothetical protein